MFSSSIDDYLLQEAPRNSSQLQSTPQTQPGLSIPNSSMLLPGILDMSFNRRSLDWSELQLFSPHASSGSLHPNPPSTDTQSIGDIYSQLSEWTFPSQPSVPPRLLLWGPFNKIEQSPPQQSGFSLEACSSTASHLTLPPHGSKAPKRGRQGYLTSVCSPLPTPPMPSKRPRTAEKDAYEFPPPPRYTAYQTSSYPTPLTSPTSQSALYFNNDSMIEESPSISPFSSHYASFQPAMPTDSKRSYFQGPIAVHSDFPYALPLHSSPSTCNYGYYPKSPISPTSPLSSSSLSSNSSPFPSSPPNGSHQLNFYNPQYSNVWSLEWHQTFNQFRHQNR